MKLDINEKELRWVLLFFIAMAIMISGGLTVASGSTSGLGDVLRAMLK